MKKIANPDVTNEDPKYWEQVLESHGLGENKHKISGAQEVTVDNEEVSFISIEEAQKLGLIDEDE